MRSIRLPVAVLLLLLSASVPQAVQASSKYACDYSNRLCQWNARYMFGSTVLGDKVFFNGGILSNDASTPVNGSAFEVLDLRTLSPYIVQVEDNANLTSSRYRHQLVTWGDQILAVGGQRDDAYGASRQVLNVIALDLNTRQWSPMKKFTQPSGAAEMIFEASLLFQDVLAIVAADVTSVQRIFVPLDLTTGDIVGNSNYILGADAVGLLDYPLVSIMALGANASAGFPYLVINSMRQLPNASLESILWFEVTAKGKTGVEGPLRTTASTGGLKELPGGTGGKVLTLSIIQAHGQPKLVLWASTTANFSSTGPLTAQPINVVSVYDIDESGVASGQPVVLQLSRLLVMQPLEQDFLGLQSIDLPFHGSVQVSAADVSIMPYVGIVDLVGELDSSNVNIQPWPGKGFIVRGAAIADYQCQPAATWQPFVIMVDMRQVNAAPPVVTAVSNYTWCATRRTQRVASGVVGDGAVLKSNTKLYRVDSADEPHLMVLNAQRMTNPGGQLPLADPTKPLQGAFINVDKGRVSKFTLQPAEGYPYAAGVATCTTQLNGQPVYLEHGGSYFNGTTMVVHAGFYVANVQPGQRDTRLVGVSGSREVPGATYASMACSLDGQLYVFGGLAVSDYTWEFNEVIGINMSTPVWKPQRLLFSAKLAGSSTAPSISRGEQLAMTAKGAASPGARSGHALTYLPSGTLAQLGLQSDALLLYGGSDINTTSLGEILKDEEEAAKQLNASKWDTTAWLYDIADDKWRQLAPVGDLPPGLMYHSMTVEGKQVMLFGGLRYSRTDNNVRRSTDLYVLDFSEPTPRWRKAAVDNINTQGAYQLDFPNTGIVPLPKIGAVALMHRSGISLTAIPQSIQAPSAEVFTDWGLNWGLNMTAGDWIRLPPAASTIVEQPLLLPGDIIITGGESSSSSSSGLSERGLLQKPTAAVAAAAGAATGLLELRCTGNATSAVTIRSSGAVLENVRISGCNGTAVRIEVDATGAYTSPAVLRNVHITGNKGEHGAAISLGPYTSVVIESSSITGNNATGSVIAAEAGSILQLINSTVSNNNGSAVNFTGASLTVLNSILSNNTAEHSGAIRIACPANGADVGGCNSQTVINNTRFEGNKAKQHGGALYMRDSTFAELENVTFLHNSASEGGAVMADRNTCLYNMTSVKFVNNSAAGSGGGLVMCGASCPGNITWQDAVFVNNSAGVYGGAMHLTEMANRELSGQGMFEGNVAGREGGAVYLGMWSSSFKLHNSSFTGNNATYRGGAISSLAIDSSITLINTTASSNFAGDVTLANQMQLQAGGWLTLQSEGGVVYIGGIGANLTLQNVSMEDNAAAKGGAVALSSEGGNLNVSSSSFTSNKAISIGGAVAVTERKSASISSSNFTNNELLMRREERCLAAGGGFYCLTCKDVAIRASQFLGNKACFGGGAAVLQAGNSNFVDSSFESNEASWTDAPGRVMLQQSKQGLGSGSKSQKQQEALDILGALDANTTADNGFYTGGGGLYLSVAGPANVSGSTFKNNKAYNGGGLLVLTDNCMRLDRNSGCGLVLHNSYIPASNNATGGGDGLLVTNISASIVKLQDCSAGSSLNLNTSKACLQESVLHTGSSHTSRGLLQVPASSAGSNSTLQEQAAAAAAGPDYLVTSAAELYCFRSVDTGSNSSLMEVKEACSEPMLAGPGTPFNPGFIVVDGLGRHVTQGIYDAGMPMQAQLLHVGNGSLADFAVESNSTRAIAGRAVFSGLSVSAQPGTRYKLRFTTQSGITVDRDLLLRQCWAGEATETREQGVTPKISCITCSAPSYSFYPNAPQCSQCLSLPRGAAAVCNGPAVVPASGFWQSHPRSPKLHECINPRACHRSNETIQNMSNWAYEYQKFNITQLNSARFPNGTLVLEGYMQYMCKQGYEGPLCGACQEYPIAYGHSTHTCNECARPEINNFYYFLASVFMFVMPVLNMWLHSQNVRKRSAQIRRAQIGGLQQVVARPAAAVLQQESSTQVPAAAAAAGAAGSRGKIVELASLQQQQLGAVGSADVHGVPQSDQGITSAAPLPRKDVSSKSDPIPTLHFSTSTTATSSSNAASPTATINSSSPFIIYEHESAEQPDLDRVPDLIPAAARAAAAPPVQSAALRPAASFTGRLQSVGSKMISRYLDHRLLDGGGESSPFSTNTLHSEQSQAAISTQQQQQKKMVQGAPRSVSMPVRRSVDVPQVVGAGGRGTQQQQLQRRSFKFWHTDIIMMLVNYMQLLGLLRLVRLNWPQVLQGVANFLNYADITSSGSTWVSLECSFNSWGLPRSIKRSIVLLLWPVAALAALTAYWACYAFFISWRRNRGQFRATFRRYLPHIKMSWVVMAFFLYTPTSREVISLFSCQKVDSAGAMPPEAAYTADAAAALTLAGNDWGVWTSDSNIECGKMPHLLLVILGGIPGLLWVFGLPLALGLTLRRHNRMENQQQQLASERVELQYGLMYDKYRYSCYYWETLLLIENCVLTMLLVLLQGQPPALQVLCAMAVIFIEAVLHMTFQPYACRMLDTLRRVSVFGLMTTLFLIMLVSLSQFEQQERVNIAAMAAIVAVNCCVLCLYLWAAFSEFVRWVRSLLDRDGKGYVSKQDVQFVVQQGVQKLQGWAVRLGLPAPRQQQQQAAGLGAAGLGSARRQPPLEQAVGSVLTVHPSGDAGSETRSGNVVVVHPMQPDAAAAADAPPRVGCM